MYLRHPKFSGFEEFYKRHQDRQERAIIKYRTRDGGTRQQLDDYIIIEDTVALIINEKYRLDLQVTPSQLEYLTVGYLICEGLIISFDQVNRVECKEDDKIWIWTDSVKDFFYWTEIRTSGCVGIKQQHEQLDIDVKSDISITPGTIFKAQDNLVKRSDLWRITGAAHMSALCDPQGTILHYAEDVGRHNTIDKIIGAAAIEGTDIPSMFIVTSGRLSAAMVTKAARARVPIIASVSAPMMEGIKIAEKTGVTLVAFSRENVLNVYTRHERVRLD